MNSLHRMVSVKTVGMRTDDCLQLQTKHLRGSRVPQLFPTTMSGLSRLLSAVKPGFGLDWTERPVWGVSF